MKSFWISAAGSLFVMVLGACIKHTPVYWLRDRVNAKIRADERAATAQWKMTEQLERIADRLDRGGLPRPSLLPPTARKKPALDATIARVVTSPTGMEYCVDKPRSCE